VDWGYTQLIQWERRFGSGIVQVAVDVMTHENC
jgi:hypothetical protein